MMNLVFALRSRKDEDHENQPDQRAGADPLEKPFVVPG
jgi:hypothetical protein